MKSFQPSRVNVEYRDGISITRPYMGRKYTMTHSDDTAELFVTIGLAYDGDKIRPLRDEVLLGFYKNEGKLELLGTVLIDSEEMKGDSEKRSEIFERELPTALRAIRYADRYLFETYPMLDNIPIRIWFQSTNPKYNKDHHYGTMKDYQLNRRTE